jgi:hypothetical protein
VGAWGVGSFDNDDANEWLDRLDSPAHIDRALRAVAEAASDQYVSAASCAAALAAAELVAACAGRPPMQLPEPAAAWVRQRSGILDADLRARAANAVDRVERDSELADLFDETAVHEEWHAVLRDLLERLR